MKIAFPWKEERYRWSSGQFRVIRDLKIGTEITSKAFIECFYHEETDSYTYVCFTPSLFLGSVGSLETAQLAIDEWLKNEGYKFTDKKFSLLIE